MAFFFTGYFVTSLSLTLSAKTERLLYQRIARKAGAKIRDIFTELHTEVLSRTPMNSGRTLGSWYGSAGIAMVYDIESMFGEGYFSYDPAKFPQTNNLPIGAEPGRGTFVKIALASTKNIDFERNPYRVFWLTNGASLDSIANSDLPQGPGSRAAQVEYGDIPGYDLYKSTPTTPVYSFAPRAQAPLRLSVEKIRLKYGK